MVFKKRGQAALEFLTTYGWAFLVLLVMISALAYFGIMNPSKFLPERCSFTTGLDCVDHQATYTDASNATLSFYLTDNLGESLQSITISANTGGDSTNCDTITPPKAGDSFEVTCKNVQGAFSKGEKTKFFVNGTYKTTRGKYDKILEGEIYALVN